MRQSPPPSAGVARVASENVAPAPRPKPRRWKRVLKWTLAVSVVLLLLVVAVIVFRNPLLRVATRLSISDETGMSTEIDHLALGFTDASLQITGLKIVNPPKFGGLPFIEIPEIYFKISTDSSSRELSFTEVRFHVAQIRVVRNEAGEVNIDAVKKTRRVKKRKKKKTPEMDMGRIEKLVVTVGKINFVDLGHPENDHEIDLHIDHEVMTGIKNETDLQARIVALAGRVALEQYFKQPKALNRRSLTDFLREVTGQ